MNRKKLIREQLEKSLSQLIPLRDINSPPKGWIKAIRNAVGMTAKQLANRVGIAQQAVARIEKDEVTGSVTIKTMRRVADGLNCVFVYGFVPRSSLEATLRDQARQYATRQISQASQTMALEDQELSTNENDKMLSDMVDELVYKSPSTLWDE